VADVLAKSQDKTRLPGLWPVRVDASAALDSPDMASGTDFSLGDGAAAAYESLAKMVALLGGKDAAFAKMYSRSADAALQHLAYRPMVPEGEDILFVGEAVAENANDNNDKAKATLRTSADHASCSVGGMLALGGRLVGNPAHVEAGRKLTQGCAWAYEQTLSGVMPASLDLTPCPGESASSIRQSATADACAWNKTIWEHAITARQRLTAGGAAASSLSRFNATIFARKQNLPQGFAAIPDPSHALGPQAIESIFILSRIMGGGSSGRASRSSKSEGESSNGSDNQDDTWMDMAWSMWQSIDDLTRTDLAYGGARTVNPRSGEEDDARAEPRNDVMPSVWMGATLKYYFLVFSEPEFLSLDKWVFSTGGHPFRRMG
jgi:mannosyl-oligosaccharide alpha-1,2-mannosidase